MNSSRVKGIMARIVTKTMAGGEEQDEPMQIGTAVILTGLPPFRQDTLDSLEIYRAFLVAGIVLEIVLNGMYSQMSSKHDGTRRAGEQLRPPALFHLSCSLFAMGVTGFRNSYKSPGRHWTAQVDDLDNHELQQLEVYLRRSLSTAATTGEVSAGVILLVPPVALAASSALITSIYRGSCAHKKFRIISKKLAERKIEPLPIDFLRDAIVPMVA